MSETHIRNIPEFDTARLDLFWEKVDKSPGFGPNGDCWRWTAGTVSGYGNFGFHVEGKVCTFLSHRISYFLEYGEQPDEACCHMCDNPLCVNPSHLFSGTLVDNVADREQKGRGGGSKRRGINNGRYTKPENTCRGERWHAFNTDEVKEKKVKGLKEFYKQNPNAAKGSNNSRAKLTEEDVKNIRSAYAAGGISSLKLAARYNVSKQVILCIIHRKLWAHVV